MSNEIKLLKNRINKNLHLGVSSCAILLVGLTYGIYPTKVLPLLFDFNVESLDLKNVFRAIMGLYLGMGIYWILGITKSYYWRTATLTNVIFMGGLAFGRIISLLADGIPSISFTIGLVLEIFFMLWGIRNLKTNNTNI